MLLSTFWTLLASNGSIKSNFVNAGSLTQKNSLLLDMKYMDFYGRLPGIKKYFVAAGISYWRDFVIMGFDCIHIFPGHYYQLHANCRCNSAQQCTSKPTYCK